MLALVAISAFCVNFTLLTLRIRIKAFLSVSVFRSLNDPALTVILKQGLYERERLCKYELELWSHKAQNRLETPYNYSSVSNQSPDNQYSFKNRCERLKFFRDYARKFEGLKQHEATIKVQLTLPSKKDKQLQSRKRFLLLVWSFVSCKFCCIRFPGFFSHSYRWQYIISCNRPKQPETI